VPVALIAITRDFPRELEMAIRRHRQVVHFHSLPQFCALTERQSWPAVVVARPSPWNRAIEGKVADHAAIGLYGGGLARAWPDTVSRLRTQDEVDSWLGHTLLQKSRVPAPLPSSADAAGVDGFARGRFLVVGEAEDPGARLLAALQRIRPVQRVRSLADVPPELRHPAHWTGIVVCGALDPDTHAIARAPSTIAQWFNVSNRRPDPDLLHIVQDEFELRFWLAHVLAFEHTGNLAIATAVQRFSIEFGLPPLLAEVLAVASRTARLEDRARRLGVSNEQARTLLKELSYAARGLSVPALVTKLLA
jgi:hypothetical protein